MAASGLAPAYDYFLDFVIEKATPQEILSFELPAEAKQRAIELLDKQDTNALTAEETTELEQMRQVDRLLSALKARALAASAAVSRLGLPDLLALVTANAPPQALRIWRAAS